VSLDLHLFGPPHYRRLRFAATCFVVLCASLSVCQTRPADVLCTNGSGNFDAVFRNGVKVHVGAARNDGLATRTCSAKLAWDNQELTVATGAAQLDLDAFGVDLGGGIPVAAFQIRESDGDCCMEYQIYSLAKPPRLLRTITGGDTYAASDSDMDGTIEIWTHDAAAVNRFENLSLAEFDFPPTVVFRLVQGQLVDVSSEFQSYFDGEIAKLQSGIQSQDRTDFKSSDGKLESNDSASVERLHRLRLVKIKALEIVWAYLYSGREQDAWRALAEVWPASDLDRIHVALNNAMARGVRSQVDVTLAGHSSGGKKHAHIFDAVSKPRAGNKMEISAPQAILLRRPPPSKMQPDGKPESVILLNLVIDGAGKVRSVEPAMRMQADEELMNAAMLWKFIPAFKDNRPVASRIRLEVSSQQ
jgi:hypothetical protein